MSPTGMEIGDLRKRYGETVALDGVSFEVRAGEVFGFVGPNGAGKTTTMRIVLGVLAADSGTVSWDGVPLTFEMRRRIGYMPEERGLYPRMPLLEQLVFLARLHGLEEADARAEGLRWLQRLELGERVDEDVQALSRGNQQRVQLAAALSFRPAALFLDEPFAGLDPVAVDVMSQVLRDQARAGLPVLFSSHQLELVEQLCDRVGIIVKGRLVAYGTRDELRSAGAQRYWVDAPAAPAGWAARLAGVRVERTDGTRVLLTLDGGADGQAILRAALDTGPVREFTPDRPTLAELFREVVSEPR